MLRKIFHRILLKSENNIFLHQHNLNSKQWHKVMIAGKSVNDLSDKIKSKQFPVWCEPLLQHSCNGDSMLELGSGTGELSAILGIYGRIPYLLDYSEDSINYAKAISRN